MNSTRFAPLLCAAALLFASGARAQVHNPSVPVKMEGQVAFVEGPAYHADGSVYFSDVENNRIMRRKADGEIEVFRQPSGRANGLIFDREGRLVACEGAAVGGYRRITRTEADGQLTVLTDHFEGKKYNSPNDLTIDSKGRIYFTDPRYGSREGMEMRTPGGAPIEGVYRIDGPGKVTRILAFEVDRPNGIAVTPDDKWLYLVDNNNGQFGTRKIWRFGLDADGNVKPNSRKEMFDFGRSRGGDGLKVDTEGRIYVAAGRSMNAPNETIELRGGIYVIAPDGRLLDVIPVTIDEVTNLCFGGPGLNTLFITAGHTLFSTPVKATGHVAWPKVAK
ncbi:MAG: SMP-30/gluconolactonase/LRE family protein [Verrucomicrobia bacterium]|nr:SMP-30/gluconolactonase/LRE family protein [Verrucomicrobiota bacterium]